ncbi:MAG: 3-oxoacyl-ACP reductase FabG [Candidatus Marinimicrobia bacterium]|nr:3-oxoacyl-ACP reductase FabG [Candidatus Neomarinimicrobiota bacterium]
MRGLRDKTVIITGAGQGIGKATAIRFSEEGAKVVIADLNETTGQAVADGIQSTGGEAIFTYVNVADRDSVKAMVSSAIKTYGGIDVLVNNAGIIEDVTLKKLRDEQFDKVIKVNLRGTFICTQEVTAVMCEQGSGVILNASSVVALYGNFGQTNYVASKSGVIGMTKVWARELAKDGIRVNAVAPGFIQTDMLAHIPEDIMTKLANKVPLKRMGTPEDIAAAYVFLASDDANYINGTVLSVDGGVVV